MTSPRLTLSAGQIEGKWQDNHKIAVFKGIPYAKAPVGDLRWRAPQPVEPWQGIKKTTAFSPTAWQRAVEMRTFLSSLVEGQGWGFLRTFLFSTLVKVMPLPKQSEDCLYLNVWTPSLTSDAKLPVMVWIHGGDHQDGSAADPYYDSDSIAKEGVVFVSINYRLGLMGNFCHPELSAESPHGVSGNYGTMDQIAALKWVQDNIAAFGGDAENVTIFGESAGGESVAHMMTSPLAKGLFHKAIMQSPANGGQMMHLRERFLDYPTGEELGNKFAKCAGVSAEDQLKQLRAMSAKELRKVVSQEVEYGVFYPVIDGHVLPKSPFEAFHDGEQADVPLIVGSNTDEGTLIYPIFEATMPEFRYRPMEKNQQPDIFFDEYGTDAEQLCTLYPGLKERDTKAEIDFLGDGMFGSKSRWYAEYAAQSGEEEAYLYMFTRTPHSPTQKAGAFHAAELPFVHGKATPMLPMSDADWKLSATMIEHWTTFAKTGNPSSASQGSWESFDPAKPRWMQFGLDAVEMAAVNREEKYQLLNRRTLRHIQTIKALHINQVKV